MTPSYPAAAAFTLPMPLKTLDFHPRDPRWLFVAGGGGEGRTGVPNKIVLIDSQRPDSLRQLVELDLPRSEDAVESLAVSRSSATTTNNNNKNNNNNNYPPDTDSIVVLAGINSSMAEQVQGRNQHLRSFLIELARTSTGNRKSSTSTSTSTSTPSPSPFADVRVASAKERCRASMFQPDLRPAGRNPEAYQKTLRLSRFEGSSSNSSNSSGGNKRRIALVATGMQDRGELVVFNAATDTPNQGDILSRLQLPSSEEVADADILPIHNDERPGRKRGGGGGGGGKGAVGNDANVFEVAYTQGSVLSTFRLKAKRPSPASLAVPEITEAYRATATVAGARIRGFRSLTPGSFVVLQNLPQQSGCELLLVVDGHVHDRRCLPRSVKSGLSIDACQLPVCGNDRSRSNSSSLRYHHHHHGGGNGGGNQFVVAVAGTDYSIAVFTIDQRVDNAASSSSSSSSFSRIKPYTRLSNVHGLTIKKVAFSVPYHPPTSSSSSSPVLKLASISIGSSLVVHTFPLTTHPLSSARPATTKPSSSSSASPTMRLTLPGSVPRYDTKDLLTSLLAILFVLLVAIMLQLYAESRGSSILPPSSRPWEWLRPIAGRHNRALAS